jgi:hypothetical protein
MKKKEPLVAPYGVGGCAEKKSHIKREQCRSTFLPSDIGGVPEDVLFGQNFDLVGEHMRAVDGCVRRSYIGMDVNGTERRISDC